MDIEQRIASLERSRRRYRLAVVVLAGLLAAGAGEQWTRLGSVQATELLLTDGTQVTSITPGRIAITSGKAGVFLALKKGAPSVEVVSPEGRRVGFDAAGVAVVEQDTTVAAFSEQGVACINGKNRAMLLTRSGASLLLKTDKGARLIEPDPGDVAASQPALDAR